MRGELGQLRRIGAIGDVHCEVDTLQAALDALEGQNIEATLCVGDLVDGHGDADRTLEVLKERGVLCVAGNHERWFLNGDMRDLAHATHSLNDASISYLKSLERIRRFETVRGPLMLCHGVGEDDEAWLRPSTRGFALQAIPTLRDLMLDETVRFMLGGHSHEHMVREFPGLTVVNAGTLHRKDVPVYVVIDFDELEVLFYSARSESFGEVLQKNALPIPKPPQ